ncbi:MAG: ergothioneine biosynthesis protein EgtB [Rhodocyclales bacterium]|nr:ergothioneine biosynthesis protein EgtB [Rhodocyclales bacterium]
MNARSGIDGALREAIAARYRAVRALTQQLAEPLSAEDQGLQSMPDASPTKWHLAHTSWFFEALILGPLQPGYTPFDARFHFLFNSYYESLGPRQPRPQRGLISRPGCDEIRRYRAHVDAAMQCFIAGCDAAVWEGARPLVELGLNHEQQHQELILTDIKHALSMNAFDPAYLTIAPPAAGSAPALAWCDFPSGQVMIGHDGADFAFDNEGPRHAVLLSPYRLASRPVTCGEYLDFIADGGYARAGLWLSDGWAQVCEQGWQAPLYWRREGAGEWSQFTLHGRRPVATDEPVCHVSFYEAAAYAAWADARLPTEQEWEAAVAGLPVAGHWLEAAALQPRPAPAGPGLQQAFGDVWEWTRSAYDPYPGFRPLPGAAAEYNGKFMVGQLVLRGGSCASPSGHLRASYRNFFPPAARWQFSGIRLARDP